MIVGQFAAFGNWSAGNGRRVLEWTKRVRDDVGSDGSLGKELVGFSPLASALTAGIGGLIYMGRLDEASSLSTEAERVVEELQQLEVLTWLRIFQAELAYARGSPEFTPDEGRRSLEIAEQLGMQESAIKVAAHRLRKQYRNQLRACIAETVDSEDEIEAEIRQLFSAFSN